MKNEMNSESIAEKRPGGMPPLSPRPVTAREKEAKQAARTEEDRRKARCCFTGHRPEKLKRPADDIKVDLENEILRAIREGYTTFITGMASGTDLWAGNIVCRLKDRFSELKLIAAIPFPEFEESWDQAWQNKYRRLLEAADCVRVIAPEYSPQAFQARNKWMVDRSSRVIAVYNGQPGGTRNTIQYARQKGIEVRCLNG